MHISFHSGTARALPKKFALWFAGQLESWEVAAGALIGNCIDLMRSTREILAELVPVSTSPWGQYMYTCRYQLASSP